MEKFVKLTILVLPCILCLIFIFSSKTFASEVSSSKIQNFQQDDRSLDWTELPLKEDVPSNKIWTITFNKTIDKSSLDNAPIYVTDNYGSIIKNVDLQLNKDGKSVKVVPNFAYLPAHAYYLYITNRIKATSGYPLSKPQCMTFTINANATKIDKYYNNHSIKLKSGDIIQLTLPENRDGGYFWNFKPDLDSNILKIIDTINISPSSSPNLIGGVGKKRWLIQAVGAGQTLINLKESSYHSEILDTFNLTITVE
ncbi:protease inhibitor I42 family protein [Clostridium autoethanogenum]|uniref:Protease inhibitor I42 family protein n=1 Tax=Clostridium autoethanogenum DSM 10061 TaxID=1341692 RepID=A0ABM5NSG9_9CLOT|nr:protease inhibitor I42 family protein [Clostridium autoethanogenum]AGY75327.1 protease inhibitor I42 family protein [Clostridium autoethanogenum DSM 10061]ALU35492.1 Proteinase inhibitor I42/chagasin [Clostridium autoethanogenum DSM 10061]OVY52446.1 Chagasin family peptidase inhibitor I42 [Clostridium autoethanogenum]